MMYLRLKGLSLAVIFILMCGCAGTVLQPVPPEVKITNVEIGKMNFPKTNVTFSIVVNNPNNFDIDIAYIDIKLHVMDYLISSEYWSNIAVLTSHQKQNMKVPVKVDILNALTLLPQLMSESNVPYRVSGTVKLENYDKALPFFYKGDFDPGQAGGLTLNNRSGKSAARSYRF